MEFDWDDENIAHIRRHGVTPEEAESALEDDTVDLGYQDWHDEARYGEMGVTAEGRFLMVVTTWRGAKIRVVTAYDSPKELIDLYFHREG